jgi:hypothetical protein
MGIKKYGYTEISCDVCGEEISIGTWKRRE